jgi:hypothetical protein
MPHPQGNPRLCSNAWRSRRHAVLAQPGGDHAYEEVDHSELLDLYPRKWYSPLLDRLPWVETIRIHEVPEHAEGVWRAFLYGRAMGAPLTPGMEDICKVKRAGARATLLCFHASARLSRGEGTPTTRAVWAQMAHVPIELVERIVVLADLEIPDSMLRIRPTNRTVTVVHHLLPS